MESETSTTPPETSSDTASVRNDNNYVEPDTSGLSSSEQNLYNEYRAVSHFTPEQQIQRAKAVIAENETVVHDFQDMKQKIKTQDLRNESKDLHTELVSTLVSDKDLKIVTTLYNTLSNRDESTLDVSQKAFVKAIARKLKTISTMQGIKSREDGDKILEDMKDYSPSIQEALNKKYKNTRSLQGNVISDLPKISGMQDANSMKEYQRAISRSDLSPAKKDELYNKTRVFLQRQVNEENSRK